jgi:hypothetical protein
MLSKFEEFFKIFEFLSVENKSSKNFSQKSKMFEKTVKITVSILLVNFRTKTCSSTCLRLRWSWSISALAPTRRRHRTRILMVSLSSPFISFFICDPIRKKERENSVCIPQLVGKTVILFFRVCVCKKTVPLPSVQFKFTKKERNETFVRIASGKFQ